ncbi:TLD-domain-containing protein [Xylariaceae sp. FL1272]|nr:TLD-domain-containing protein [Xylariaceae sp. FL1272]
MSRYETGNLIDFSDDDLPSRSAGSTPFPALHSPTIQSLSPAQSRTSSPSRFHRPQKSPPPSLQKSPSGSGYGIGSAVWGLLRRISTVEGLPNQAPTPPPGASQLYHQNAAYSQPNAGIPGAGGDGINGAFTPPRRVATPRGLPSLEPLNLNGYRDDTDPDERILSRGIAEEIRTFLPERLKIMEDWQLIYSLYQNGSSLGTLYQKCDEFRGKRAGFVLVVRDVRDGVFGAYLNEAPHPAPSYFGTGECFLWRASLHAPLPPPPSADTTNLNYRTTTIVSPTSSTFPSNGFSDSPHLAPSATDPVTNKLPSPAHTQSIRFQTFSYTGANDYCMLCETKFLSVGGGSGAYGLWLNDSLSRGHSGTCDTFLNQPLSDEGDKFDVIGVELWVVGTT